MSRNTWLDICGKPNLWWIYGYKTYVIYIYSRVGWKQAFTNILPVYIYNIIIYFNDQWCAHTHTQIIYIYTTWADNSVVDWVRKIQKGPWQNGSFWKVWASSTLSHFLMHSTEHMWSNAHMLLFKNLALSLSLHRRLTSFTIHTYSAYHKLRIPGKKIVKPASLEFSLNPSQMSLPIAASSWHENWSTPYWKHSNILSLPLLQGHPG